MAEVTLTSGYGTGLREKQYQSRAWVLNPQVLSTETVSGGVDLSNATPLSTKTTVSFVTTATNKSLVKLANGVTGQVKIIVHTIRANSTNLIITPDNFANGTRITSNAAPRSVVLMFDGDNWQVIAGEITGTQEMVLGT